MKFLQWAALCVALSACAALPNIKDMIRGEANESITSGPLHQYRAELQINVGGKDFDGIAATKAFGPVNMKIESKFGLDRIQITSCGRQDVHRSVDKGWFGGSGKKLDYTYEPLGKETEGPCPIYIEAFNKGGLAAWGFIGFRNDEELPATIVCNGRKITYAGYSVCQTKAGLQQVLTFTEKVDDWEADVECNMVTKDGKSFELRPQMGLCVATFYKAGKWHTLNLFGYSKVVVQGE